MRPGRLKKPEVYPERSRIHPYLTARRRRQLDQWVADQGVSESRAVDDAIGVLCETRGGPASVLYQRLDHMSRTLEASSSVPATLERLERHLEALGLFQALFLRGWMQNTSPLSADQRRALQPAAVEGYQRFMAALAKALLSGRSLIHELPEDVQLELRARAHEHAAGATPDRADAPSPGAVSPGPRASR